MRIFRPESSTTSRAIIRSHFRRPETPARLDRGEQRLRCPPRFAVHAAFALAFTAGAGVVAGTAPTGAASESFAAVLCAFVRRTVRAIAYDAIAPGLFC